MKTNPTTQNPAVPVVVGWTNLRVLLRATLLTSALYGLAARTSSVHAQDFVFTKIVDNNDPIPGRAGALFTVADQPALDRSTVVFRNGNSLSPDSIWSITLGEEPKKLVDFNTEVPGGIGKFSSFIINFSQPGIPQLRNATVVFPGRDSNSTVGFNAGLYSIPVDGGTVTRVVDYNTLAPNAGSNFDNAFGLYSFDAGKIAFQGAAEGTGGVYTVNVDGSSLRAIADGEHPTGPDIFRVVNFSSPSISGNNVLFYGGTVFDSSTGYNGLYLNSADTPFSYTLVADSERALPGDANSASHLRYNSLMLDGGTAAFVADDFNTSNPRYFGLFTTPTSGGAFTKIVSSSDILPGLDTMNLNSLSQYSFQDGSIAFLGLDNEDHYGLYLAKADGTALTKIAATGESGPFGDLRAMLGGLNGNSVNLGINAVSNGSVVFRAFGGIYLATPTAQSADLQTSLTHTPATGPIGTILTYTFTVTNAGPAIAANPDASITLPAGLTFQTVSQGGASDGISKVSFNDLGNLASGETRSFTLTARIDAPGSLTTGGFAFSRTPDPDLNNNHAQDIAAPPAPASNDGRYVFAKIVTTSTTVPDQPDRTFALPAGGGTPPALDGGKVIFLAADLDNKSVLWSANASGGGLTRLVDGTTPIPGNEDDAFANISYLRLRGGQAVFLGFGTAQHNGFFAVPVGGGAVRSLVNQDSLRPEGTGTSFGFQGFIQSFAAGFLGDGFMGFAAQGGIYAYPVNGGTPRVLVYPNSSLLGADNRVSVNFGVPAFSGTRAVFQGTNSSELLGTFTDEHRFFAYADPHTVSPSGSTAGETFSVDNGDNFAQPQLEGGTVVFRGLTGPSPELRGFYSITDDGPAVKLADTNTPVPGGSGNFSGFTAGGSPELIALHDGEAVFIGQDATSRGGLYSVPATGGPVTKIVAIGDSLGGTLILTGNPIFNQQPIQPNSLGGHQLAFRGDYFDSSTNTGGTGIFVATPAALAIPTVTLEVVNSPVTSQHGGKIVLRLTRTGGDMSQPLTVNFKLKGSAQSGVNYRGLMTTKTILAGAASRKIKISPIDTDVAGGTKVIKLKIVPDANYTVGTTKLLKLRITQD